jgi:hypothetical protein
MATSKKVQTSKGAKVTTVVTSNKAVSGDLSELTLEVISNGKAGFTWGDNGAVLSLVKGGIAEKAGVSIAYRLHAINDTIVTSEMNKADIEKVLLTARRKKYSVTFKLPQDKVDPSLEGGTAAAAIIGESRESSGATSSEKKDGETIPDNLVNEGNSNPDIVPSTSSGDGGRENSDKCANMSPDEIAEAIRLEEEKMKLEAEALAQKLEEERLAAIAAEEARKAEEERLFKLRNGKVN